MKGSIDMTDFMEFLVIIASVCSMGCFMLVAFLFDRINKIERKFIEKGIIDA